MLPDFSKLTVEVLSKRAAFRCSNPDCQIATVGPNVEPDKVTMIGEAAHIRGARSSAPRFDDGMTDAARGEITNGIWLCRNCHRTIDADPVAYPVELLFEWREGHEARVSEELGTASYRIRKKREAEHLHQFQGYPAIIRRIAIDKPDGWEWRLTAELLRFLNADHFRRLRDLREGLYTVRPVRIAEDDALSWVQETIDSMSLLFGPLERLLKKLTESWGAPGEPGDIDQIHHICRLIREAVTRIVAHEEAVRFARLPDPYLPIQRLLEDASGTQAEKLAELPAVLDDAVGLLGTEHGGTVEKPLILEKTIIVSLPDGWADDMDRALRKATRGARWIG